MGIAPEAFLYGAMQMIAGVSCSSLLLFTVLRQGQKKKPAVMIRRQQGIPEEPFHPCPSRFPQPSRSELSLIVPGEKIADPAGKFVNEPANADAALTGF